MPEIAPAPGFIIFVESNTSGSGRLFVEKCRRLGWTPVLFSQAPQRYAFATDPGLEVVQVDTTSVDEMVQACRRLAARGKVQGVWSSSEYSIQMASALAARLGLPGNDPRAIARCRSKHLQRKTLQQAGFRVPRFQLVSPGDLFPVDWGRVIVKPVHGSGSVGVTLCSNLDEFERAVTAVRQLGNRWAPHGEGEAAPVLMEEYLDGTEYSVEIFNGAPVGVTAKHLGPLPAFVEIGHDFPASIDQPSWRALTGTSVEACLALGLGWGPLHVELRIVEEQAIVIEINPRLAGGFIPVLIEQSVGIDLISQTIKLVAGQAAVTQASARRFASLRFLLAPGSGTLSQMPVQEDFDAAGAQVQLVAYKTPGEAIAVHGDFRDRIGHVIAVEASPELARMRAERARDRHQRDVRFVAVAGADT